MSDMKAEPIVIKLKTKHLALICVVGLFALSLCGYFFLMKPYLRFADAFRSPPHVMLEVYEYDDNGKKVNTIKKKIEDQRDIETLWESMDILPFKRWSFSAVPKPNEWPSQGELNYPGIAVINGEDRGVPIIIYHNGKTHWGLTPDNQGYWQMPALEAAFHELAEKARKEAHNKKGMDGRQSPSNQP